ncbi:MAG: tetratricopeptide repeat protein [Armatimonadota bacterium]
MSRNTQKSNDTVEPDSVELERRLKRLDMRLSAGHIEEAQKLAQELVADFPESTSAHEMYGDVYIAAGDSAEARKHYRKAMELEPANADAERKFGAALINMSDTERRRKMIQDLLSGADDHAVDSRRPLNATLIALVFPGLGQLYNREHEKGIIAFVLAAVLVILLFHWLVLTPWEMVVARSADQKLSFAGQLQEAEQVLSTMPWTYWVPVVGALLLLLGIYIYGIWDAYTTARKRSRDHDVLGV